MTTSGDNPPVEAVDPVRLLTTSVQKLSDRVEKLSDRADALQQYGRRTRMVTWGLAFSVTVDVVVSVVALVAIGQAQSASDAAEQNRQTQISTCTATNVARAQNKELWDYVLAVPPSKPPTEAQRKLRAEFQARVDRIFAPRDCSRI